MNELGTTHIESLDQEVVSIPGIDVDNALDKTIALGQKKLRAKRIRNASVGLLTLVAISLIGFNLSSIFGTTNDLVKTDVINSAQKQFEKVNTSDISDTTPEPVTQTSTPPTNPAPVITPKLVNVRSFGNSGLCNVSAGSIDPGPGGVVIGPSTSVQTWNPGIGQTRVENVPTSGRQIVLKNTASNNATNGAYVDLISGFDTSNSYANVNTLGFTYCEQGYKLEISPNSGSGYTISTTSL